MTKLLLTQSNLTGGTIVSLPSGVSESVTEKAAAQNKKGIFFYVRSNSDIKQIAALLEKGALKTHVSKQFLFEDIQQAHQLLQSGRAKGKIVLQVR